jgi:hypothetical protein
MTLEGVMGAISQLMAMVWISQPRPEISPASQIARNVTFLSGANGPAPAAGFRTSITGSFPTSVHGAPVDSEPDGGFLCHDLCLESAISVSGS